MKDENPSFVRAFFLYIFPLIVQTRYCTLHPLSLSLQFLNIVQTVPSHVLCNIKSVKNKLT